VVYCYDVRVKADIYNNIVFSYWLCFPVCSLQYSLCIHDMAALLKFNIKAASLDIIQPLDFNFAVLCANCYMINYSVCMIMGYWKIGT